MYDNKRHGNELLLLPLQDNNEQMNLYTNKKRWKWVLAIVALLIVGASLWYTNYLVKSIAEQETNQVKMWAAAME